VPGRHNLLNATAAVAIGVQLGVAPEQIALGLDGFRGVDRRFQVRGVARGVTVIDDYGHHPTEIAATLRAARECSYRRIHVLFQPHRYTRTRDLMSEFAAAFADADTVQVLDVYAASEDPIPGIDGTTLAAAIAARAPGDVAYAPSSADGLDALAACAQPGDAILTLGAGNVSQLAPALLDVLERVPEESPVSS
jgi:UDP-N-acetylmuramate--alanine ligase